MVQMVFDHDCYGFEVGSTLISRKKSLKKEWYVTAVCLIFSSAGSLWLLLYWKEQWQLWFTHQKISLNLGNVLQFHGILLVTIIFFN